MTSTAEQIRQSLQLLERQTRDTVERLSEQIRQAVREEQLRDQLTGLPNDRALTIALEAALELGRPFWVAFVEIDNFKMVNKRYGYLRADGLLKEVAGQLAGCRGLFPEGVTAYRAHGDEYYLLGSNEATGVDGVARKLEHVRARIEQIALHADDGKDMSCTVSVGWRSCSAADGPTEGERGLRRDLELALLAAKRAGRNRVEQYRHGLQKQEDRDLRADCAACGTSFNCFIPLARPEPTELHCPACGKRVPLGQHEPPSSDPTQPI